MLSKAFMPYCIVVASAMTMSSCQPSDPIVGKTSSNQNQNPSEMTITTPAEPVSAADAERKKISEALGNFIGKNLKSPGMEFDVDSLVLGVRNGAAGKPSPLSDEEYEKAMLELQQKAVTTMAANNLEAAEKFMKENAKEQDVIELEPGKVQYKILTEGNGPTVPEHGTPTINYTGRFIDGTVFGTTENGTGAISIPIDNTVPGFTKGVAGMKEGEKRRLFVHPDAGYGKTGQLPPNSLLIFDIEVVKAQPAPGDLSSKDDSDLLDSVDDEDDTDEDQDNEPKSDKK